MKRFLLRARIAAVLALIAAFSACTRESGSTTGDGDIIEVYRVLSADHRRDGELLRAEAVEIDNGEAPFEEAIKALGEEPLEPALAGSLAGGVRILSYETDASGVALVLSGEYKDLTAYERTMANFCMTLTLCGLEGINAVRVKVEGEKAGAWMTPGDAVLYDEEANPDEMAAQLFFADGGGRYLRAEYRKLEVTGDTRLDVLVVEELLRGPSGEGLFPAVPEGTALLGVSTHEGACTVNLSGEFGAAGLTPNARRLAVFSIVNTLTSLSGVSSVRILMEGQRVEALDGMLLEEPVYRNREAEIFEGQNTIYADVDIFLGSSDGEGLVAVPRLVEKGSGYAALRNAIRELLDAHDEPCYYNPFTAEDVINSIKLNEGLCIADLPESFFAEREAPQTRLALLSIASTAIASGACERVQITMDGEPPEYGGVSFDSFYKKSE